jgi:hypothetical protein
MGQNNPQHDQFYISSPHDGHAGLSVAMSPPSSLPLATTELLSVWICLFWMLHINEFTPYVAFSLSVFFYLLQCFQDSPEL